MQSEVTFVDREAGDDWARPHAKPEWDIGQVARMRIGAQLSKSKQTLASFNVVLCDEGC